MINEARTKQPKMSPQAIDYVKDFVNAGYNYFVKDTEDTILAFEGKPVDEGGHWKVYKEIPYKFKCNGMFPFIKPLRGEPWDLHWLLPKEELAEPEKEHEGPNYISKEMLNNMVEDGELDSLEEYEGLGEIDIDLDMEINEDYCEDEFYYDEELDEWIYIGD